MSSLDTRRFCIGAAVLFVSSGMAGAVQAQSLPPIRQLGPRLAVTRDTIGSISGIRPLSDGRVIVNDPTSGRLLLFDSTLQRAKIIADSTPSTAKAYGGGGDIFAYTADSTLFAERNSLSFLVLGPDGKIARVMAAPRPKDLASGPGRGLGQGAGVDAMGRLVYRPSTFRVLNAPVAGANGASSGTVGPPRHDSSEVVRVDIATRVIDTVGFLAWAPPPLATNVVAPDGTRIFTVTTNPLWVVDDWALLADGSIALVRGGDYHIDWMSIDGTRSSTPRMAHVWTTLTDSIKTALIDSLRRRADSVSRSDSLRQTRVDSAARARGEKPTPPTFKRIERYVDPSELPNYAQPFVSGGIRADADNRLWIRQADIAGLGTGPPVYDIVSRQGAVIDRVQLPASLTIAGFATGVVYLTSREGYGTVLLKYRIR